MALQYFHIGYLYENHAAILSDERCLEEFKEVCEGFTRESLRLKAIE